MTLLSNNVCFNCENLAENITCTKHDLIVNLDNYCEDHKYKKSLNKSSSCGNCMKYQSDNCHNPNYAADKLLCFSWEAKN